jgi:hypothetical protein
MGQVGGIFALRLVFSNSDAVYMAFSHLLNRLGNAINEQKKYERTAKLFKLMNGSLLFGQYIVGAALGTSFLKLSFSSQLVGFLGTFVVVSAAARQKYRPESVASDAETRSALLAGVINDVQDNLVKIGCAGVDAPDTADRLNAITHDLSTVLARLKMGIKVPSSPFRKRGSRSTNEPEIDD